MSGLNPSGMRVKLSSSRGKPAERKEDSQPVAIRDPLKTKHNPNGSKSVSSGSVSHRGSLESRAVKKNSTASRASLSYKDEQQHESSEDEHTTATDGVSSRPSPLRAKRKFREMPMIHSEEVDRENPSEHQEVAKRQKTSDTNNTRATSPRIDNSTVLLIKEMIMQGNKELLSNLKGSTGSNGQVLEVQKQLTNIQHVLQQHSDILESLVYVSSSKNKNKTATDRRKKLQVELSLLDDIFNETALERVFERCTMGKMAEILSCCLKTNISRQASLAVRVILYAKSVQERVAVYDSGVAKELSLFRESIVRTFVSSVRQNVFNQFSDVDPKGVARNSNSATAIETNSTDDINSEVKQVSRPKWLCDGYITNDHFEYAKKKREAIQGDESTKSTGIIKDKGINLTRCEIGREVCDRIYKIVINRMKTGRETAKNSFFQEVGYIFTIWDQLMSPVLKKKLISQESVDLQWYCEDVEDFSIELQDIESTMAVPRTNLDFASADDEPSPSQKNNVKKFANFIERHPEMCLSVSHDVLVKSVQKQKVLYEKRTLNHSINLLDVAARFLSNFVGLKRPTSPMSILSSGADSIKVIYSIAMLFKGLINKVMMEISENNSVLFRNNVDDDDYGEYFPARYEGICLDDLFPSKTRQTKTMDKVLLITHGEYFSMNEVKDKRRTRGQIDGEKSSDDEGGVDEGEGDDNAEECERPVPIYRID